jgi:hypothetical protein
MMPLVTISLSESWSLWDRKLIADGVHDAIVGVGFPQNDRFQIMSKPMVAIKTH